MSSTQRQLKVDIEEIIWALENNPYESDHYLDIELGKIISFSTEVNNLIE
jgi:hypothetical protein